MTDTVSELGNSGTAINPPYKTIVSIGSKLAGRQVVVLDDLVSGVTMVSIVFPMGRVYLPSNFTPQIIATSVID